MSSVREPTRLMRELEDQLAVWMGCGMCQAVCPLFERTGREADVARGKLALLDGPTKEMFDDPKGDCDRLKKCLLCGSCAANRPGGVNVLDIFMKARAILTGHMGLPPAKRVALRQPLSRPEMFDRAAERGARFQKLVAKAVNEVVGASWARVVSPLLGNRHFRTLADRFFHADTPALDTPPGKSGPRVALFPGRLLDKIFPEVARAAVKALEHRGVGVFMPEGQACRGIPAVGSGDMKTFRSVVRHNLDRFERGGFDRLVTACASRTSTIGEVRPALLDGELGRRSERIAAKTVDVNAFLVNDLGVAAAEPANGARKATYHVPCHLKKSLGVAAEPRAVLRANPNVRRVEMGKPDWCCGMGGSFNLRYRDISSRIGPKKRDNIAAAQPDAVATGCPACVLQISDMLSRAGDRIAVTRPVQLYAESLP
ncbi:MAG: (Fe-S)-binding protein [Desulfococcaceae bacterium]